MTKRGAMKWILGGMAMAGLLMAWRRDLTLSHYPIFLPVGKEDWDGLRIAHLSDLHSAPLAQPLYQCLQEGNPDAIVVTGDWVNREDRDFTTALQVMERVAQVAPVYYAPGNHEADNPEYPVLRRKLEALGVVVLENQSRVLWWNGGPVNLIGLWDIRKQRIPPFPGHTGVGMLCQQLVQPQALNLLLSHRPALFPEYQQSGSDVVFCGHAHGGQVRLPGFGPLYSTDEGILPTYTQGVYPSSTTTMVVSRGLGNGTPAPRLWNGPELVFVTFYRRTSP